MGSLESLQFCCVREHCPARACWWSGWKSFVWQRPAVLSDPAFGCMQDEFPKKFFTFLPILD
jgi:hypothetical protein